MHREYMFTAICELLFYLADFMFLLQGKVVCVTGASRGIGRAAVVECAKHGASGIIVHYFGDDATTEEAYNLKHEIEGTYTGCKTLLVPGDIAVHDTSIQVRNIFLSVCERSLKLRSSDSEPGRKGIQSDW